MRKHYIFRKCLTFICFCFFINCRLLLLNFVPDLAGKQPIYCNFTLSFILIEHLYLKMPWPFTIVLYCAINSKEN